MDSVLLYCSSNSKWYWKKKVDPVDQHMNLSLVSLVKFIIFFFKPQYGLPVTRSAGIWQDTALCGENEVWSQFRRARWKSFKLGLKREGDDSKPAHDTGYHSQVKRTRWYNDEGNRKTEGKHCRGIKELSSKKVTRPAAQLKCLYANIHRLGNKPELEATVLLENYNAIAITNLVAWFPWPERGCWWLQAVQNKDRQGRRGGGISLCIKEGI